jgi:hypothetical protein
MGRGHW